MNCCEYGPSVLKPCTSLKFYITGSKSFECYNPECYACPVPLMMSVVMPSIFMLKVIMLCGPQ